MTTARTFDTWKAFLAEQVNRAQATGVNDQVISTLAYEIGGFLNDKIDPKNVEERLLKNMWDVASEAERKTLAALMVKLVDQK
jgi:hypothetical protein